MIALVSHSLISSRVETGPARPSLSASSRLKRSAGKLSRFGSLLRIGASLVSFVSPSVADSMIAPPPPSMDQPSRIAMRFSSASKRERFAVSRTDVGERVGAYLRRLYADRTAENVAADLEPWGIKAETIAAMLQRQTSPNAIFMLAMIWAYGPDFLAEVHPAKMGWLHGAVRAEQLAATERKIDALRAELELLK